MKPTFNANMFESIKSALENAKSKQSGSKYKEILKLDAPATYVVRLLPNVKAPSETFLHYYHHGWNSINTGQYVNVISPSTWGERCPVSELYFKVLRYGRQLNKIIEAAINGDDASEFGAKVFDLGANGCNLRIKAELVSDKPGAPKYPTYTASKFLSPSEIEGVDEDKAAEIYESIHDLNEFVEHKSAAEIQEFIQTHYYGKEQNASATTVVEKNSSEEEDVPYESPKPAAKPAPAPAPARPAAKPAPKIEAVDNSANDDKVKAILDGLDDL